MLSTTDQVRPAFSISVLRFRISSSLHTAPFGIWCNALTTPVAPACRTSLSFTGSFGPNHRQVCSILIICSQKVFRGKKKLQGAFVLQSFGDAIEVLFWWR